MAKRIELTSEKNFIGDSKYKSDDGLVYRILSDNQAVSVECSDEARNTLVHADIANEVVIDGIVYPVVETSSEGFRECLSLEKVTFPPNMKLIRNYTFIHRDGPFVYGNLPKLQHVVLDGCLDLENNDCTLRNLKRVDYDSMLSFLKSATIIDSETIYIDGKELPEDLVIPEGITIVRKELMKGSTSLRTVTLPSSIQTISSRAFEDCENLEKVNFPEGLKIIESNAFCECKKLAEVQFPSTLEAIGSLAFSRTAITKVSIPNGCQLYGNVFEECSKLESVTLPENITVIPKCLFNGCISLKVFSMPQNVTEIGSMAFCGCKSLTSMNLPETLTSIGDFAFAWMPLTELTIPASVSMIDIGIFEGCDNLANVYCKIVDPSKCDVKAMELTPSQANSYIFTEAGEQVFYRQATLHIPNAKGMASAYKKKAAWKKFSNIMTDL